LVCPKAGGVLAFSPVTGNGGYFPTSNYGGRVGVHCRMYRGGKRDTTVGLKKKYTTFAVKGGSSGHGVVGGLTAALGTFAGRRSRKLLPLGTVEWREEKMSRKPCIESHSPGNPS